MGDWYDVILTVDLQPDVPPAELAELRWHLGLGDRPADLTIVAGEPWHAAAPRTGSAAY
ncbi:hypothetical protein [Kribbella soli]|uniref:hypothetical protein n=1 Tax=Kribbella soli TaxID=1124743 RepID=UPI0013F455E2|nr:hypothetical protein [Kribbella soli]